MVDGSGKGLSEEKAHSLAIDESIVAQKVSHRDPY
jgi:hypothetical protein